MRDSKLSATICISTYNRAEELSLTLDSIKKLKTDNSLDWELILIDNNSTDDTKHVADKYRESLPIRYFFEPLQGLSHARNRALQECSSDVICFTDDDMIVDPCWLKEIVQSLIDFPEADYFGGRIIPYWPHGRPRWIRDENMALVAGLLGRYDLGSVIRMYTPEDLSPYGGNFGLRKRLYEKLEPFNTGLGVKGNIYGRGEETEFFSRAKAKGLNGVYIGTALCHHTVNPLHLSLSFMYRFGIQKGIAERFINPANNIGGKLSTELLYVLKGLYQLLKGRGDRFRQCIINMGIQRGLRS
jgi:glycosyltransferase involved in cell wall biosynthesis